MVTRQGRVRITPEGFILIIVNFLSFAFLFSEHILGNIASAALPIIKLIWGVDKRDAK